jgi:cell division inhibitor SepF
VQSVIRRVRTGQPVVLAFQNTKLETAKRILDFCFGLACGLDGTVEELGDRVFVVLPANMSLSEAELDKLVADGVLTRR